MDLKNELENEVLLAILTKKRLARRIDGESSRELISKIKGVLNGEIQDIPATQPPIAISAKEYVN